MRPHTRTLRRAFEGHTARGSLCGAARRGPASLGRIAFTGACAGARRRPGCRATEGESAALVRTNTVGVRDSLDARHHYFDTVHAYIWGAVDHDLDPLLAALDRIATRLGSEPSIETE